MNVTKCTNGHFYDADKYVVCPHCGDSSAIVSEKAQEEKVDEKQHKFFWSKKRKNDVKIIPMTNDELDKTFGLFGDEGINKQKGSAVDVKNSVDYQCICEDCGRDFVSGVVETICPECKKGKQEINDDEEPQDINEETENEKKSDLAAEIKKISNDKTRGFFYVAKGNSTDEDQNQISDPIVGWIVCVKGSHFGEAFGIYSGRNSVGRAESNRIIISREKTISREKHAWITYEPKKRKFYIQPGESSGLTYLNDDNIMESRQLQNKDRIEFGDGKFIFIELCGDDFSWEDYINND